MEKKKLKELIDENLSQSQIANRLGCSKRNVRYWLEKHGLKTNHSVYNVKTKKECSHCGEKDEDKFYKTKRTICKTCHNQRVYQSATKKKKKAIEYLGGECNVCGYKKYYGALDFHHLNPSEKDLNFRHLKFWKWEKIKKELDKCVLLCRVCHAEVHGGVTKIK